MSRIEPLAVSNRNESIQLAFEKHIHDYNARITNMKATLGHSQVAFEVYMAWYPLYEEVKKIVGNRVAYLYAYAVSFAADCPLCTTFFRKLIIDAGEKPENFEVSIEEQLLLNFGSAITKDKGIIDEEIFNGIKALYNKSELVVLIAFAGQMIATNIFNNVIETDIDDYLKDYLPTNKYNKYESIT